MPKGDCFRFAFKQMQKLFDDGATDIKLCHGIITSDNGTFAHAWLEGVNNDGRYARDQYAILPWTYFYNLFCVARVIRYTVEEAQDECARHGHFGAWDESLSLVDP